MATIKIDNLEKTFHKDDQEVKVIKQLCLEFTNGTFNVLLGPSGCGKTTLLRIIAGLETATSGKILFDSDNVTNLPPQQRNAGMVFQEYALYPHMTVEENIAYPLKISGYNKRDRLRLAEEIAKNLDIWHLLKRKPSELSGGQRQRVALGRAIVREPRVLLLDEPLSNLDAKLRDQMRVELKRLHGKVKGTMIYVTHDQLEAMTLADKVAVINQGIVEQFAPPLEIFENPATEFVARFVGFPTMNIYDGIINNGKIYINKEIISDVKSDWKSTEVRVGVRPHHIIFNEEGHLSMDIEIIEPIGTELIVHGKFNGNPMIVVTTRKDLQPNTKMYFTVESINIHLFDKSTGKSLRSKLHKTENNQLQVEKAR